MHALTLVLDDEPLIVLDPGSGRRFQLTMSGVGDNYQLHTLLADRLAARVPGLEPPQRRWVAAATDAPILPGGLRSSSAAAASSTATAPTSTQKGTRPTSSRSTARGPWFSTRRWAGWSAGRTYQHMRPALTLDHELSPAETASWLARVAPARENDLMGINRR